MAPTLCQVCEQLGELAEETLKGLASRKLDSPAKFAAAYMFVKGYKSYQAALLLFRNGFWQDAASIARTVLELAFQSIWLDKDPENAGKLFLSGLDRDQIKEMKNLKLNGDEETRAQADWILQELCSNDDFDASWRNWWGKESNIEKLAKEAGCEGAYKLRYRPLSGFIHSLPLYARYFLGNDRDTMPDCSPCAPAENDARFAELCFSESFALQDILAVVDNVFRLNLQEHFDRFAQTRRAYTEARLAAVESADIK